MSRQTTFTCDECGQRIGMLDKPLFVTVNAPADTTLNSEVEFCSLTCFAKWAVKFGQPRGKQTG